MTRRCAGLRFVARLGFTTVACGVLLFGSAAASLFGRVSLRCRKALVFEIENGTAFILVPAHDEREAWVAFDFSLYHGLEWETSAWSWYEYDGQYMLDFDPFVCGLGLAFAGAILIVFSRWRVRRGPFSCPDCGYDRRAAPTSRCSECGSTQPVRREVESQAQDPAQ